MLRTVDAQGLGQGDRVARPDVSLTERLVENPLGDPGAASQLADGVDPAGRGQIPQDVWVDRGGSHLDQVRPS